MTVRRNGAIDYCSLEAVVVLVCFSIRWEAL